MTNVRKMTGLLALCFAFTLALFSLTACGQHGGNQNSNAQGSASQGQTSDSADDESTEVENVDGKSSVTLSDGDVEFLVTHEGTEKITEKDDDGKDVDYRVTYKIVATNNGKDTVSDWTCTIPFNGEVDVESATGCSADDEDSSVYVLPLDSAKSLKPGKSAEMTIVLDADNQNLAIFM